MTIRPDMRITDLTLDEMKALLPEVAKRAGGRSEKARAYHWLMEDLVARIASF